MKRKIKDMTTQHLKNSIRLLDQVPDYIGGGYDSEDMWCDINPDFLDVQRTIDKMKGELKKRKNKNLNEVDIVLRNLSKCTATN